MVPHNVITTTAFFYRGCDTQLRGSTHAMQPGSIKCLRSHHFCALVPFRAFKPLCTGPPRCPPFSGHASPRTWPCPCSCTCTSRTCRLPSRRSRSSARRLPYCSSFCATTVPSAMARGALTPPPQRVASLRFHTAVYSCSHAWRGTLAAARGGLASVRERAGPIHADPGEDQVGDVDVFHCGDDLRYCFGRGGRGVSGVLASESWIVREPDGKVTASGRPVQRPGRGARGACSVTCSGDAVA